MATELAELMYAALNRTIIIADNKFTRPDNIEQWYEFAKQAILDESFTNDEKSEVIRSLTRL